MLLCVQNLVLAQDQVIKFDQHVLPILTEHCLECHNTEDSNGGLNLEDSATLFKIADSGKHPVVRKLPQESELFQRTIQKDLDIRMPPEGAPLSTEQISVLSKWIIEGARIPEAYSTRQSASPVKHWSFAPIASPHPPHIVDDTWSTSPLDRFLQRERELAGIDTVPLAAPETLLRRASYALTGLPPTRHEVEAFLTETSNSNDLPRAYATVIDELLSRRTYGERWGRHWMDWVRYADTSGDNSDFPIPQAYLYRNYIIDSINNDVPYDQFLTEQLAGDLLPAETLEERNRQVIATGYLAMARRFGSLVETYPWHLTIEDTIDNVGRTMMGMTVACARCHDHKFDPISTRDYYGLYGIFASTQYAFPGTELFQVQQDLVPLLPEAEVQAVLGEHQAKTEELTKELNDWLAKCRKRELEIAEVESTLTLAERRKRHDQLQSMLLKARKAGTALADHLKQLPEVPTAYAVREGKPTEAQVQIKGEPTRLGAKVPRKFPEILGGYTVKDQAQSGRLELAKWITSSNNPLTARVIVNRVWQRHFGRGLVGSTSDFGLRGEKPTHPDLLDWLATEFMTNGWSLKHLHRVIMNSQTYRLASLGPTDVVDEAQSKDPENKLYWKFSRHRLDAESIRDTILFLSGELDPTPQNEPYPIPSQKEWKYTQHHPFKAEYPSNKRSVYQMTKRLTVGSYMQTFDGPDPNVCTSRRDQSVTALQALFFVNDEFLHKQARKIANSYVVDSNQETQLKQLFYEVLCRQPDNSEVAMLSNHLAQASSRLQSSGVPDEELESLAWSSLVRSLFRLNEFLYVD